MEKIPQEYLNSFLSKHPGLAECRNDIQLAFDSIRNCFESGGNTKKLCDVCICVPASETYLVQELHLPVYHTICAMLELEFFSDTDM